MSLIVAYVVDYFIKHSLDFPEVTVILKLYDNSEYKSRKKTGGQSQKWQNCADQWCFSIRKLSSPFKVFPSLPSIEGKKSRTKNNFMPCLNVSFKRQTTLLIDELIVNGKHRKNNARIRNRRHSEGEGDTQADSWEKFQFCTMFGFFFTENGSNTDLLLCFMSADCH